MVTEHAHALLLLSRSKTIADVARHVWDQGAFPDPGASTGPR